MIVWREQMSVGIKAIDDDHQQLISLINQFDDLVKDSAGLNGPNEQNVRSLLGRLQAYTQDHFSREERIQEQANYEGLRENRQHHIALTKALKSMIARFLEGELAEKPLTEQELSKFLNSWLVDHIIKVDLKMRGTSFRGVW